MVERLSRDRKIPARLQTLKKINVYTFLKDFQLYYYAPYTVLLTKDRLLKNIFQCHNVSAGVEYTIMCDLAEGLKWNGTSLKCCQAELSLYGPLLCQHNSEVDVFTLLETTEILHFCELFNEIAFQTSFTLQDCALMCNEGSINTCVYVQCMRAH